MKKKKSKIEKIWNHLKSGKRLTQLQALNKFNCMRLSPAIGRLNRKHGNCIVNLTTDGTFGVYQVTTN